MPAILRIKLEIMIFINNKKDRRCENTIQSYIPQKIFILYPLN
jgi:hypothetical protein